MGKYCDSVFLIISRFSKFEEAHEYQRPGERRKCGTVNILRGYPGSGQTIFTMRHERRGGDGGGGWRGRWKIRSLSFASLSTIDRGSRFPAIPLRARRELLSLLSALPTMLWFNRDRAGTLAWARYFHLPSLARLWVFLPSSLVSVTTRASRARVPRGGVGRTFDIPHCYPPREPKKSLARFFRV